MRQASKLKKVALALFLVGVATTLSLSLFEIILRVFYPQQEAMRWFESDPRYGYVMRKNFSQLFSYPGFDYVMEVKTNSMGLRDSEYPAVVFQDPEIERVLLLGDSFTFGFAVDAEDTFDRQLEQRLNSAGSQYVVLNAGVGGWGTVQETSYAKDHFDMFNPDVIVLTFCGNDPDDDLMFKFRLRDNEKGIVRFPGKVFLRNHSHLYRFLFKRLNILVHNLALKQKADDQFREVEKEVQSGSLISEEDWTNTLETIRAFHRDFLDFNPEGVLLVQATAPWNEDIREHLSSLADGKTLFYVDLYDDSVKLSPEDRRLPHDGHWSVRMHTIAASNLAAWFREARVSRVRGEADPSSEQPAK